MEALRQFAGSGRARTLRIDVSRRDPAGYSVVGVQVHAGTGTRFPASRHGAACFVELDPRHVETPSGMGGLRIRHDGGVKTLLVGESQAGIRTYIYAP